MNDDEMRRLNEIMMLDVPDVIYSRESRNAVIMKTADLVSELVRRELQRNTPQVPPTVENE